LFWPWIGIQSCILGDNYLQNTVKSLDRSVVKVVDFLPQTHHHWCGFEPCYLSPKDYQLYQLFLTYYNSALCLTHTRITGLYMHSNNFSILHVPMMCCVYILHLHFCFTIAKCYMIITCTIINSNFIHILTFLTKVYVRFVFLHLITVCNCPRSVICNTVNTVALVKYSNVILLLNKRICSGHESGFNHVFSETIIFKTLWRVWIGQYTIGWTKYLSIYYRLNQILVYILSIGFNYRLYQLVVYILPAKLVLYARHFHQIVCLCTAT
jgi:hypothetical protein